MNFSDALFITRFLLLRRRVANGERSPKVFEIDAAARAASAAPAAVPSPAPAAAPPAPVASSPAGTTTTEVVPSISPKASISEANADVQPDGSSTAGPLRTPRSTRRSAIRQATAAAAVGVRTRSQSFAVPSTAESASESSNSSACDDAGSAAHSAVGGAACPARVAVPPSDVPPSLIPHAQFEAAASKDRSTAPDVRPARAERTLARHLLVPTLYGFIVDESVDAAMSNAGAERIADAVAAKDWFPLEIRAGAAVASRWLRANPGLHEAGRHYAALKLEPPPSEVQSSLILTQLERLCADIDRREKSSAGRCPSMETVAAIINVCCSQMRFLRDDPLIREQIWPSEAF